VPYSRQRKPPQRSSKGRVHAARTTGDQRTTFATNRKTSTHLQGGTLQLGTEQGPRATSLEGTNPVYYSQGPPAVSIRSSKIPKSGTGDTLNIAKITRQFVKATSTQP